MEVVFLVLGRAWHAAIGDDDVTLCVEQQLVRVDAVGLPFGQRLQCAALAHTDPSLPVAQVGFGGVEQRAIGRDFGMAAKPCRGAVLVKPDLADELAGAVTTQHPGAGARAQHQQAAIGFGQQAVGAGGQRYCIADRKCACLPVGDQGAGEVGVIGIGAAPGGANDGLAVCLGGKRQAGQGGAGARGGEGEKKLAAVHGGAP